MSDPFASAQEFSQFIKVDLPTDLARIQQLLGSASAAIRRYAGQTLSQVVGDVDILEAVERDTLILSERPVTTITTVVVNGVTLSASTDYYATDLDKLAGLLRSGKLGSRGTNWSSGATVTYDHGYAESSDEYATIKTICMEAAARAYTLNERSASEFLGSTLAESAGYAPEVFLTPGEKMQLADLGKVLVG